IHGGKMDGFLAQAATATHHCVGPNDPRCGSAHADDVLGYHDAHEIPNYWTYANHFVLQDHLFEANASWSLPQHLFMVSEWSATCSVATDPLSCANELNRPALPPDFKVASRRQARAATAPAPDYAWTDLTYLLHAHQVSWGYYIVAGEEPDCEDS